MPISVINIRLVIVKPTVNVFAVQKCCSLANLRLVKRHLPRAAKFLSAQFLIRLCVYTGFCQFSIPNYKILYFIIECKSNV